MTLLMSRPQTWWPYSNQGTYTTNTHRNKSEDNNSLFLIGQIPYWFPARNSLRLWTNSEAAKAQGTSVVRNLMVTVVSKFTSTADCALTSIGHQYHSTSEYGNNVYHKFLKITGKQSSNQHQARRNRPQTCCGENSPSKWLRYATPWWLDHAPFITTM